MKIEVQKITSRQKLIIEKGLCDYRYIMKNWKKNDSDFQSVFYDFYLKARWAVMSKPENTTPYFDLLQKISMDEPMEDILEELRAAMKDHSYEFYLVSKMRHTRDPRLPIYDSKVRAYLSKEEGISFWWHHTGTPRGTGEMEKIMHDWKALCDWYQALMMSERGKSWIEWFDACFPNDRGISNVKKIDFIIFATGE